VCREQKSLRTNGIVEVGEINEEVEINKDGETLTNMRSKEVPEENENIEIRDVEN